MSSLSGRTGTELFLMKVVLSYIQWDQLSKSMKLYISGPFDFYSERSEAFRPSVARVYGQLGNRSVQKKTHPTTNHQPPTNKRYTIYEGVSPKILKPTQIFKKGISNLNLRTNYTFRLDPLGPAVHSIILLFTLSKSVLRAKSQWLSILILFKTLFPKGEFLEELFEWVLFFCRDFTCFIVWKFLDPYDLYLNCGGWVVVVLVVVMVVVVGGGA